MIRIIKSVVLGLFIFTFFSNSQAQQPTERKTDENKYGLLQKIKLAKADDVLALIQQSGKSEIDGILSSNRENRQESSDGRTHVTFTMQAEVSKFEDEDTYKLVKKFGAIVKERLQKQKAEVRDISGRAEDVEIYYKLGCVVGSLGIYSLVSSKNTLFIFFIFHESYCNSQKSNKISRK